MHQTLRCCRICSCTGIRLSVRIPRLTHIRGSTVIRLGSPFSPHRNPYIPATSRRLPACLVLFWHLVNRTVPLLLFLMVLGAFTSCGSAGAVAGLNGLRERLFGRIYVFPPDMCLVQSPFTAMNAFVFNAVPPTSGRRAPTHPVKCLRIVELPKCVVCSKPTAFYCGGCRACPAFCSGEHFMAVGDVLFSRLASTNRRRTQYWPVHSMTCDRNISGFTIDQSGRDFAPMHPYPSTVSLRTRNAIDPPPPLSGPASPDPDTLDRPYDYKVIGLYAKHDARPYAFPIEALVFIDLRVYRGVWLRQHQSSTYPCTRRSDRLRDGLLPAYVHRQVVCGPTRHQPSFSRVAVPYFLLFGLVRWQV